MRRTFAGPVVARMLRTLQMLRMLRMLSVVVLLPAGGVAAGVAFPSPLGAALWGVVNKNQSRYWVFFYRVFRWPVCCVGNVCRVFDQIVLGFFFT